MYSINAGVKNFVFRLINIRFDIPSDVKKCVRLATETVNVKYKSDDRNLCM